VPAPDGKRVYRSAARQEQAARTRAAIRDAATARFSVQGYAATGLRQVAADAGVAERTLYATFSSKQALFVHCLGVATVGDEEPVAAPDRPALEQALADPDPREAVRRALAFGAELLDRAGRLIVVAIEAAAGEPELRRVADEGSAATYGIHLRLAKRLAATGDLAPGLTPRAGADVLYALASPHVHQLLRADRGWSARRYETWLVQTVTAQLLGTSSPAAPGGAGATLRG